MKLTKLGALCAEAASLVLAAQPVAAKEIVTYTYDARGRLVKVVHAGSVNDGVTTEYHLDKANNRTKVKTSGGTN